MNPVKEVRTRIGISRTKLAMLADVSYSEVFRAETGKTRELNNVLARFLSDHRLLDSPEEAYIKWREAQKTVALSEFSI